MSSESSSRTDRTLVASSGSGTEVRPVTPARRLPTRFTLARRISLRLIVIALVPVIGLAWFASDETVGRQQTAQVARDVERQTGILLDLIQLRYLISFEEVPSLALAFGPSVGLSPAQISEILGTDLGRLSADARDQVDAALTAHADDTTLADVSRRLHGVRGLTTQEDVSKGKLLQGYSDLLGEVDRLADAQLRVTFEALPGDIPVERLRTVLDHLYQVHVATRAAASQLTGYFDAALPGLGFGDGTLAGSLAGETAIYQSTTANFTSTLTGNAATEWARLERDPEVESFERQIDQTLSGDAPSFVADLSSMSTTVRAGLHRHAAFLDVLTGASNDVRDAARHLRNDAMLAFRTAMLVLVVVSVLSAIVIYFVGRSISRPLQRLSRYAASVSAGDVHAERPHRRHGPIEVQTVDAAFDDVVANLQAIDAHALALAAGHLDDPVLATPLPGRLGQSLQASVEQLSRSIAEREDLHRRLAHESTHDGLTGVPNRSAAMFTLESAIARNRRRETSLAVLFVDLDDFKRTNDTLGHATGDEVLRETSRRLQQLARTDDTIARLGADEFLVVAEAVGSIHDAVDIGERIVASLSAPMEVHGRTVRVGASVGIAMLMDGTTTADDLVREADLAVYRAKDEGRGRVEVFDTDMRSEVNQRSDMEARLTEALHRDELTISYQPVVSAAGLFVRGFEALVRWRDVDGTPIPPDSFIPIAEASDLIIELDRWVIRRATAELAGWARSGIGADLHLAVNVSGRHLVDRRIVDDVAEALQLSGLDPTRLVLEITETVLLSDMPVACAHLEQVRALGVTIAIDDFGSGYTSLATLRNLPVDVLKIDRSLVAEMQPEKGQSLVRLLIEAAHEFGMGVIAEGVETEEQRAMLETLGCEQVQGWLVSPAVPADQALQLVTTLAG